MGRRRSWWEQRVRMEPGGPRDSTERATFSVGRCDSRTGADVSSLGTKCGAESTAAVAGRVVSFERNTRMQRQPVEGHVSAGAWCAASLPSAEQPSFTSAAGVKQQQRKGAVPHVRPSHCQDANSCGAIDETSSASRATNQSVRWGFTGALWLKSRYRRRWRGFSRSVPQRLTPTTGWSTSDENAIESVASTSNATLAAVNGDQRLQWSMSEGSNEHSAEA